MDKARTQMAQFILTYVLLSFLMAADVQESEASTSQMSGEKPPQKKGKRPGRKPVKVDVKAKLERSRQSARECRARKKLRYQYIEELVANREKAVFALREELQTCKEWCEQIDAGFISEELQKIVIQEKKKNQEIKKEQSYLPFSKHSMPVTKENNLGPIYRQSETSVCSSPSQQFVNQSPLSVPLSVPLNTQCMSHGASNAVLENHDPSPSYMLNRPSVSKLSEKDQIYSWYLFLKDDEERFSMDTSGTPRPSEVGTSSGVPSVVTDYLDVTNSSDSSNS